MADPRQTLQDLIRRFGTSLSEDPQRCQGMLRDLCGSSKREIAGLVAAIEERIPVELMKGQPSLVNLRAQMIQQLEDNRALAPEIAAWTVDTWGLVLGTWTPAELDGFSPLSPQEQPAILQSSTPPQPVTQPPSEPVIDLTPVPVDLPPLDRALDLSLDLMVQERSEPDRVISTPVSSLGNQTFTLPNTGGQLELIAVPGGTLTMEGGHQVNLQPFLIGKYPVTQRQYQAVVGKNPSHFKRNLEQPVERVTWHEALTFCEQLSEILNLLIDLPSETQWEWAARGATKSKGYTYAGSNNLDEVGWYNRNSGRKTHLVGQKKPNELGLYDMSGNLWEWCKDNWTDTPKDLPSDGSPLTTGGDCDRRGVRGGSWNHYPGLCRCAQRNWYGPVYRCYNRGFRVVVSAL